MHYKSILAIGAHPDDIEYGCLGFLHQHSSSSAVHLCVASLGSMTDQTSGALRKKETMDALSILNANTTIIREEKGLMVQDFQILLSWLEDKINQVNPDLILTHGPNDSHQEHKMLYELVVAASRRRKLSILRYAIVSNTSYFQPNYFFGLSEEMLQLKISQLAYHKTQSNKYYMTPEYIRDFHKRPYTLLHDLPYCETFEIERIME